MKPNTIENLFLDQIRGLYDVEKQLVRALPKMAKAAESEELAEGLRSHLVETNEHVSRLEQIFDLCGETPKVRACKTIRALIAESKPVATMKGPIQDLMIIRAGQEAEHIEMASYGNARTLAEKLGKKDAVELLEQTLEEEKNADKKLTEVTPSIMDRAESDAGAEEKGMALEEA